MTTLCQDVVPTAAAPDTVPTAPSAAGDPLSEREQVVLAELAGDRSLEQIAQRLWVSRNTVKTQVRSIYRKIGVSTRADAVAWARAADLALRSETR
jgi:DNA-binding CsgD family transcriptional regulator